MLSRAALMLALGLAAVLSPLLAQPRQPQAAAPSATAPSATAAAPEAAAAVNAPAAALRFVATPEPAPPWLPASVFSPQDRAVASAAPPLRVAVLRAGAAAHVDVADNGAVQGPLVHWLLATAQQLGLTLVPLLVADEAAATQALREGRADLALALSPPAGGAMPGLVYSLGTGAQPLAWVVARDKRPVPLDRARIAHLAVAETQTADRLRRHYPAATLLPQPSATRALQAVAESRADAYVGALLPALAALQQTAIAGLELRQVWPGAAGHHHLVLRDNLASLLPAFNKALAAWRATPAPHQAVLGAAQRAAPKLRAPLALPADLAGADTAVMDRLLKAPHLLSPHAAERLRLAERSTWRVGVLRGGPTPAAAATTAALSGLDAEGRHTGVASDLLQELALRLGVLVQLVPFDGDAALLKALQAGQIDVLPLLEHTPQQARGLRHSLPWLELPQVLVGAESGPLYWSLDSLRGRRLAVANSHPLRAELQRLYPGIQLVDATDGAHALGLVRLGQADTALDIKPVVQRYLGSPEGQGLRVLGDVAEFAARYRLAVPEAQGLLMPALDAALADVDQEEKLRSLRRWLVTEPVALRPWWHSPWWPGALAAAALAFAGLAAWGWGLNLRRQAGATPPAPLSQPTPTSTPVPVAAAPAQPSTDQVSNLPGTSKLELEVLLRSLVAPFYQQAEAAGQRLVWTLDEVLPARIHTDPQRLAELLQVLLKRALALMADEGTQGRLALRAQRSSLENGHPALQLLVTTSAAADTEAAAQDPRVLRALDLAVALGGDLVVRSRPGLGHAVSVRLPLRGARRVEAGASAGSKPGAPPALDKSPAD